MYSWKTHFIAQADYQHWANEVLLDALDHLQADVIESDQGLYCGSIHRAIDQMLLVQQMWFARLQGETLTADHRVLHHPDWRELKQALRRETRKLQSWLDMQPEGFFDGEITFIGREGGQHRMWVREVLVQLFTHAAHQRGQITAVITRMGGPLPDVDFVSYRREMDRLLTERRA